MRFLEDSIVDSLTSSISRETEEEKNLIDMSIFKVMMIRHIISLIYLHMTYIDDKLSVLTMIIDVIELNFTDRLSDVL